MKLEQLVNIISGRTFKHGIPESPDWTHSVIQLRDIDKRSDALGIDLEQLSRTRLSNCISPPKSELIKNDILIVAKGLEKRAIQIFDIPQGVLVNQHFFILRVKDFTKTHPTFLKNYLNSSTAQMWMNNNSVGRYQSTMSKKVLSQLAVPAIHYEKQKSIAENTESKQFQIFKHEQLIEELMLEVDSIYTNIWQDQ